MCSGQIFGLHTELYCLVILRTQSPQLNYFKEKHVDSFCPVHIEKLCFL